MKKEAERILELEQEIQKLKDGERMLGKRDIMQIFGKGADFALRFLRVAKASGYGVKVGKEYYISRNSYEKMMANYAGLHIEI